MKTLTLLDWLDADLEKRAVWLSEKDVELDDTSRQVLGWAYTFKTAGAIVSDNTIKTVYQQIMAGYIIHA